MMMNWMIDQRSHALSAPYHELVSSFLDYFKTEARAIGDNDLDQEVDVLELLLKN